MKNPIIQTLLVSLLLCNTFVSIMTLTRVQMLERKSITSIELPENFNFAYTRLKAFNPLIDSSTVIKIVSTANKFKITNKLENFKWGIGQLLTESGGSQYRKETGKLLVSSGGAIGIGQILPSTAYWYLLSVAKEEDIKILKELGCDDFSFITNKKLSKNAKLVHAKDWLKNETNNIAMWGFIMKNNLEAHKGVMTALATYNLGDGGLKTYLDSGNVIQKNEYVVAVRQNVNYVEGLIN